MNVRNRLEEQRRRNKKAQIKENVLFGIVAGFILVATCMLLANMNNKQMNDCMNAGHSVSYCERGL